MNPRTMRRRYLPGLLFGLRVVWPVMSAVLVLIVGLGIVVGLREGWSVQESIYFSFVTGLTIGYGDLAPKTLSRARARHPHRRVRRHPDGAGRGRRRQGNYGPASDE
jgi:hypothetical protein